MCRLRGPCEESSRGCGRDEPWNQEWGVTVFRPAHCVFDCRETACTGVHLASSPVRDPSSNTRHGTLLMIVFIVACRCEGCITWRGVGSIVREAGAHKEYTQIFAKGSQTLRKSFAKWQSGLGLPKLPQRWSLGDHPAEPAGASVPCLGTELAGQRLTHPESPTRQGAAKSISSLLRHLIVPPGWRWLRWLFSWLWGDS